MAVVINDLVHNVETVLCYVMFFCIHLLEILPEMRVMPGKLHLCSFFFSNTHISDITSICC